MLREKEVGSGFVARKPSIGEGMVGAKTEVVNGLKSFGDFV